MPNFLDLTGRIFGRLTVIRRVENTAGGHHRWLCRCICGNEKVIQRSSFISGDTRSCGCLRIEATRQRVTKHGALRDGQKTPEYRAWRDMLTRATNPRFIGHRYYKNVTVCEKWRTSFVAFLADVGPQPSPQHSLDRFPDPWGSYEPGNVRWATLVEQANNKRTNRMLTYNGRTQNVTQWANELCVPVNTLRSRMMRGWMDTEVLSIPVRTHG